MVSKIFVLSGADGNGKLVKILLGIFVLCTVIISISVCIYTFRSGSEYWPVCPPPSLSENGLSNYTTRSEHITYACMSGYALEGNETMIVSRCNVEDKTWIPPPPICADIPYLPILLNCNVTQHGIRGRISIWQEDDLSPTFVSGYINTTNVNETESAITEQIQLSMSSCSVSHETPIKLPDQIDCTNVDNCFNIKLNSTMLISYQKMDLRIIIIFIDHTQTAFFVTLHQNGISIIMKEPLIVPHVTTTTAAPTPSTTTLSTTPSTSTITTTQEYTTSVYPTKQEPY